jgi:hypothetical protein
VARQQRNFPRDDTEPGPAWSDALWFGRDASEHVRYRAAKVKIDLISGLLVKNQELLYCHRVSIYLGFAGFQNKPKWPIYNTFPAEEGDISIHSYILPGHNYLVNKIRVIILHVVQAPRSSFPPPDRHAASDT